MSAHLALRGIRSVEDGRSAGSGPLPHRGRRPFLAVLLVLGLLATVAAGAWGLSVDRRHPDEMAASGNGGDWTAVPGGHLRLDSVTGNGLAHATMPGMQLMADPVPAGFTRFSIQVTLAAQDQDLSWAAGDFRVSGPGLRPTRPIRVQLGDGVVARGTALSGALTYDVPEDASDLVLRFREGIPIPLPDLRPDGNDGDDGMRRPGVTGTGPEGTAQHDEMPGAAVHRH